MNKKYIKLFAVSTLAFLASASIASAKTYTKIEDLVKDVETWREKENKENNESLTDGYIYVVGNYVFTSNFQFDTLNYLADAWQSIPSGSKTYIYQINRTYDENFEPTGWDIAGKVNLFNNGAKLPDLMNVYYLDEELAENTVNSDDDVKLLVERANAAVNNPENKEIYGAYELAYDEETHTITVNTKKNIALNSIKNSDVVATLYSILTRGTYSSVEINGTQINARGADVRSMKGTLATALGGLSGTKLVDLTKKQPIKVSFTPANGIKNVADVDGKLEYTIKFTAEVDTNSYFEVVVNNRPEYTLTCDKVDGELCTPVLNIIQNTGFGGLRLIADVIEKGFAVGSKSVSMTINNSVKSEVLTFVGTWQTDADAVFNTIKNNFGITKYADLEGLNISLKFEADTEKGYTFAGGETSAVYNFTIGSYLDLNSAITSVQKSHDGSYTLNISEDGKTINIEVPLSAGANTYDKSKKTANLSDLELVLNAIVEKTSDVTSVTINGKKYEKNTSADGTKLEAIIKEIIGTDVDITFEDLLKMNELTIEVTKKDDVKFIPTASNVSGNKATYKVNLVFTGADLTAIRDNFEVSSNGHLKAEFDESGKVLTVDLKEVNNTVDKVSGTTIIQKFMPVYKVLKSVSINGASIDFASIATAEGPENTLKEDILSKLGISKETLLKDLVGKEYTVKMVLNDKVKPEDSTESELEFTIKFISSAVVELTGAEGEKSLADLVKSGSKVEIIYLSKDYVIPSKTLTIAEEGLTIVGDGKSVLTGNIVVNADNVTFDKVVIKGVAVARKEGKDTFVIDASAKDNFTLTNSTISYDNNKDTHYAYGMVKVGGKVVIKGNTIDITNVKNPIEFNVNSNYAKDGTEISDNHFTGNNYIVNGPEAGMRPNRNVISIYGVDDDDATIYIQNNTFDYAHRAVRISNFNENKRANYYITDNKVINNKTYTTDLNEQEYLVSDGKVAFVKLQADNKADSLSTVKVTFRGNYANGSLVKHIADKYSADDYTTGYDRFAWTDVSTNQARIECLD